MTHWEPNQLSLMFSHWCTRITKCDKKGTTSDQYNTMKMGVNIRLGRARSPFKCDIIKLHLIMDDSQWFTFESTLCGDRHEYLIFCFWQWKDSHTRFLHYRIWPYDIIITIVQCRLTSQAQGLGIELIFFHNYLMHLHLFSEEQLAITRKKFASNLNQLFNRKIKF